MPYAEVQLATKRASVLLRAMGNERRRLILCHLASGEQSVNQLCALVGLGQSALSQHLAKLRRDGLVQTRRCAQQVYYSVACAEVPHLLEALRGICCQESRDERNGTPTPGTHACD